MALLATRLRATRRDGLRVLDLGGSYEYWEPLLTLLPSGLLRSVRILNLPPVEEQVLTCCGIPLTLRAGDARDPALEGGFDLVHSNSLLEHVGSDRDQQLVADNTMRLGTWWWVQAPSRHCPVEPHFGFPFYNHLPIRVQVALHRRFDLGHMPREPDRQRAERDCASIRLVDRTRMRSLFPGCELLVERLGPFVKSYVATNLPAPTDTPA